MFDKKRILSWLSQFKDTSRLGLLVFVAIILLTTWNGIKAVQSNYQLEKQISQLKQENDIQKLKNQNQSLQNEYYNSNQFLELSARQNFGLAAPGEKELIVPHDVAMSYIKPLPGPKVAAEKQSNPPFYVKNLKAWWNFFTGNQSN